MIKDFLQDQAALHALGLLEQEEARAFEQAMAGDADLRRLVEEHRETVAALVRALPAEVPPAALRDEVLGAVRRGGKPEPASVPTRAAGGGWRLPSLVGWGLAAGLAVTTAWLWNQNQTLDAQRRGIAMAEADARAGMVDTRAKWEAAVAERTAIAARIASVEQQLAKARDEAQGERERLTRQLAEAWQQIEGLQQKDALAQMQIATLQSSVKEYQQGVAVVVWDSERHQGILKLEKMPPLDTDKDYQLWVVDPKQKNPVDAGIVTVNAEGFAKVEFKPLSDVSEAAKFAVSVERKGGVPVAEGPIIFVGP